MILRVLVADDEAVARRRIRRYLGSDGTVTVVGECADGRAAVDAIRALVPDLVFLDVQMPELDGFEVLQAITPASRPAIVFVTAFDRYAIRAFDLHAIDYLLKPFTQDRFTLALSRAKERVASRARDGNLTTLIEQVHLARRAPARVAVHRGSRIVVIDWADVDWIEAADNYVTLHVGSAEYLLRNTLTALDRELDTARFVRVHRSAIVQIDRIVELVPETHGDFTLRLRDGSRVSLSRTFRDRVERAVGWTRG
jgi:two-component system LytT family response regulator